VTTDLVPFAAAGLMIFLLKAHKNSKNKRKSEQSA